MYEKEQMVDQFVQNFKKFLGISVSVEQMDISNDLFSNTLLRLKLDLW